MDTINQRADNPFGDAASPVHQHSIANDSGDVNRPKDLLVLNSQERGPDAQSYLHPDDLIKLKRNESDELVLDWCPSGVPITSRCFLDMIVDWSAPGVPDIQQCFGDVCVSETRPGKKWRLYMWPVFILVAVSVHIVRVKTAAQTRG